MSIQIFIYDEITNALAKEVAVTLSRAQPNTPVDVVVNSYGGEVHAAIGIMNSLLKHKGPVTLDVQGVAASGATIICCGGYVKAAANSYFMIHAPWIEMRGNAADLQREVKELDRIANTLRDAYVHKTGKPPEAFDELLSGPAFWFSAAEAKELGLVDEVYIPRQRIAARLGSLKIPQRLIQMTDTAEPALDLGADEIVRMCAAEPLVAQALLNKGVTAQAVQARLAEASQIRKMAALSRTPKADADAAIKAGMSAEVAGPHFVTLAALRDQQIVTNNVVTDSPYGGYGSNFLNAASDALATRLGGKPTQMHPAARDFDRVGVVGMAAMCVRAAGKDPIGMTHDRIIKAALTTSDFPELLSSAAYKALGKRFEAITTEHRQLAESGILKDFKPASIANVSFLPALLPKPEAGEIKYGSLLDGGTQYKLSTYARGLMFSREAMINDDLNAFSSLLQSAANSTARLERDLVFGVLTGNPVMSDNTALFHATHGNLNTGGLAIDVAGLNAARLLMRKQQDSSGGYVLTAPRYIVVPVGHEADAEALVASLTYKNATDVERDTPAWIGGLIVISDPRLDANNADDWYLLSDPATAPVIRIGYLNGQTTPDVEQEGDFDRDVLKFKIRFDVAVAAVGWAGAVKMA